MRLFNAHVPETNAQILIIDKESIICDPDLNGGIYSFESNNFEQAILNDTPSNQWVSTDPINLELAQYTPINSLNALMKEGIQLFQIGESPDFTAYDLYQHSINKEVNLYDIIDLGHMKWVNQERDIAPETPFPNPNTATNNANSINIFPSPR